MCQGPPIVELVYFLKIIYSFFIMGVVQLFRPLFFGGFQIAWLDSLALFLLGGHVFFCAMMTSIRMII